MTWRAIIFLLWAAIGVQAHSLHQSTAEADWNAETQKLEVSLTVFVNDLELALMRQSEREMRVGKTAKDVFDAQARLYLSKCFIVTDVTGQKIKIEWIGCELDASTQKTAEPTLTWFFEITLPLGLKGVSVWNGIFCDLFADEVNLLLLRKGSEKIQMLFQKGTAAQNLKS